MPQETPWVLLSCLITGVLLGSLQFAVQRLSYEPILNDSDFSATQIRPTRFATVHLLAFDAPVILLASLVTNLRPWQFGMIGAVILVRVWQSGLLFHQGESTLMAGRLVHALVLIPAFVFPLVGFLTYGLFYSR